MDQWAGGQEEELFFISSSSSSFCPTGGLSMSRCLLHFSGPSTHRSCDHWMEGNSRRTRVVSVSCRLCCNTPPQQSSYYKTCNNPRQTQVYSHNTSTTLGGVLSNAKNVEQDLKKGYKTRREPQHKTLIAYCALDSDSLFLIL